jgi:hypothetical protein
MAARKTKPEGRAKGSKTKPRDPLLPMAERGVVTPEHCELARRFFRIVAAPARMAK